MTADQGASILVPHTVNWECSVGEKFHIFHIWQYNHEAFTPFTFQK